MYVTVENPGDIEKYSTAVERPGITEDAVANAASDLRRQFAEQFRQQVRDTVGRDEDVEGELRYLVQLLQRCRSEWPEKSRGFSMIWRSNPAYSYVEVASPDAASSALLPRRETLAYFERK